MYVQPEMKYLAENCTLYCNVQTSDPRKVCLVKIGCCSGTLMRWKESVVVRPGAC
jgi:hypothetical protein